jgi:hypothetical protein
MTQKRFMPKKMLEYDELLLELKHLVAWGGDNSRILAVQRRLEALKKEGWGYEN